MISASSSARYSGEACRARSCSKEAIEVALLLGGVAGLAQLVPARVAQHGQPVPVGGLGVVAQPGRRLHDVGVGVVDDPALGVGHGHPPSRTRLPLAEYSRVAARGQYSRPPDRGGGHSPDLTPRQVGRAGLATLPGDGSARPPRGRGVPPGGPAASSTSTWSGEFAELGGRGGSGDETFGFEVRRRWEKVLAEGGWTCLGWPVEYGGRGATMTEQVIFNEEYARAAAPGRVNVMGEGLLGPTLIHYGTPEQKARFLPPIREGAELWCQGYSEPDAGSDLANVKTRAVRDGDEWVVTGQKVWTSLAHQADWCFVVCRTDPDSARHKGLSYLLVPDGPARASRCGRSPSSPAPASSTRSSSTAPAPMSTTWWAASATAGAWPWPPWPSSAAWRCSASSSASGASSTGSWRWPRRTARRATRWCASGWPRPTSS